MLSFYSLIFTYADSIIHLFEALHKYTEALAASQMPISQKFYASPSQGSYIALPYFLPDFESR